MKYMTKQWYETMQKTSFHLLLRVSRKADVFSEDYFKKLYEDEERAWLQLHNEPKTKFEDIYPDEFPVDYADCYPPDSVELEAAKKEYFEMWEQIRLGLVNAPPFDLEQEKKNFRQALRHNVSHLKRNLPDDILQKIADIRVLALNRVSGPIKKEITAYCKANDKAVEAAIKAYRKEHKKSFRNGKPAFVEEFYFHDCIVTSCRKKGKDMVLTLDNVGWFRAIRKIILKNCSILKQDTPLYGARWLYEEIYKTNHGFEIHILLEKKELVDFIVTVTDVEYK